MDQAAKIREKLDLVSFVSEYIPLKKLGRNFTALCPFHNEKSPSFIVSPERQIWHCFGCGKGGDCFTFLMEYDNMEFLEALRTLAKKTGVVLSTIPLSGVAHAKEKIYEINTLASEFYHYVLTSLPAGREALSYLKEKRKINDGLINSFGIGFAPYSGNSLSKYLIQKKKYSAKDLLDAGLVFQARGDVVDFFRGRILFPLTDHRGNIVGFSGRSINESDDGPKYINSRETAVYHKGEMFFGLSKAKEEIKKQGMAVVMEGEFDVISAFKEGITNSIAIKGTALTDAQALLIARFAPKVALCLDQDEAGISAMKRSLPILEKRGLSATIVIPPQGAKDPDEALNNNPFGFKKALKEAPSVYDFFISYFKEKYGTDTAEGKKKISDEILPSITLVQNEVVKEHYLKKLSTEIDTSVDSLLREVDKISKGTAIEEDKNETKERLSRRTLLEEYLIALIIQAENPKAMYDGILDFMVIYKFDSLVFQKIVENLFNYFEKNSEFDTKKFLENLPKELIPAFDKCFLMPVHKFDDLVKYQEEVTQVARELKGFYLRTRIKEISDKLKNNIPGSEEEAEKLRKEFSDITAQLS